ncbi:MAG: hypothetical protein C4523_20670 [Myxococcales bacterium]|nr:MAG: hypothetical protein C4523_20670 [Myxococcales bacterium]
MTESRKSHRDRALSDAFGQAQQVQEQNLAAAIDPATTDLLKANEWGTSQICNHGYFPKEIARYLIARLREAGVPCEMGFDQDLAKEKSSTTDELRSRFRDSNPFYFIGFPLQHRMKTAEIMKLTSYPLPEDPTLDQQSLELLDKAKAQEAIRKKGSITSIAFAVGAILVVLFGFAYLMKFIFQ